MTDPAYVYAVGIVCMHLPCLPQFAMKKPLRFVLLTLQELNGAW